MSKYEINIESDNHGDTENFYEIRIRIRQAMNPKQHSELLEHIEQIGDILRPFIDEYKNIEAPANEPIVIEENTELPKFLFKRRKSQ
jgi:hypothetical protein